MNPEFLQWSEKRINRARVMDSLGIVVGGLLLFFAPSLRLMLFGVGLMLVSALDYEAAVIKVMLAGLGTTEASSSGAN